MPKRSHPLTNSARRNFLKGATLASVAAITTPAIANTPLTEEARKPRKPAAPGPKLPAAETLPPTKDPTTQTTSGGDFMVDVLKTLDIDYLAMNCASSFRGLHEAVLNHGGKVKPEILN